MLLPKRWTGRDGRAARMFVHRIMQQVPSFFFAQGTVKTAHDPVRKVIFGSCWSALPYGTSGCDPAP